MVSRAQRLDLAARTANVHCLRARILSRIKDLGQPFGPDSRHVAAHDERPFGAAKSQRCLNPTEWPRTRKSFRQNRIAQMSVFLTTSHKTDAPGCTLDAIGDPCGQRNALEFEQRFILAHPAAGSPGENESGTAHETILAAANPLASVDFPMKKSGHSRYNGKNMARAICFVLACVFASPAGATGESRLHVRSVVRADAKTGRLIRTSIVKKSVSPTALKARQSASLPVEPQQVAVTDVSAIVQQTAALHGVDPALVHSVIAVESGFNPLAVSPKGAQGLMQLIPATARRFGVTDSFDARQNIAAGVKYLRYLQDMFKDDKLALAAYNAGEGAVLKYGGVPPYRETEQYVSKVGKKLESARLSFAPQAIDSKGGFAQPNELAGEKPEASPAPLHALSLVTDESGRIHFVTGEPAARKTPRMP